MGDKTIVRHYFNKHIIMKLFRWTSCLAFLTLAWSVQANEFPPGWEVMEIEAKWDASESVFNTIIDAFPDGSQKYGYDLNVRWSARPKRYTDLYYDNSKQDLFGALHAIRHRKRASTSSSISITDSFSTLGNTKFGIPNWQKVQYKSTPVRLAAVWFRTEKGAQKLTSTQVTNTLAGSAPHPANDNPVALLSSDHPGFDLNTLDVVLKVVQFRYRVEFKDPVTGIPAFELSMDKIVTTVPGQPSKSTYGVELEVLQNVESNVEKLLSLALTMEAEFGLTRAVTRKGGIQVPISKAFPAPVLTFKGTENYSIRGKKFTRYKLSITNRAAYPDSLFLASPGLPPCGANKKASRTWVDIYHGETNKRIYGFCALNSAKSLDSLWFSITQGELPPNNVYVTLRDRRGSANYTSNSVVLSKNATTVFVVRHAEKGISPPGNESLTAQGENRAKTLAQILAQSGVTAIYSTRYTRTQETVNNTAAKLSLSVQLYKTTNEVTNLIKTRQKGPTVLVAGHSNTVPQILKGLGIESPPSIGNEFNNLFVVVLHSNGGATLAHLKYEVQ